jgi:hypothetical protein
VQNLRRGHYEITADLDVHGRVRVALDDLASCSDSGKPPVISTRCPTSVNATDIPGFGLSSCGRVVVGPGGVFVVEGGGLQAAVQDADEPVAELS